MDTSVTPEPERPPPLEDYQTPRGTPATLSSIDSERLRTVLTSVRLKHGLDYRLSEETGHSKRTSPEVIRLDLSDDGADSSEHWLISVPRKGPTRRLIDSGSDEDTPAKASPSSSIPGATVSDTPSNVDSEQTVDEDEGVSEDDWTPSSPESLPPGESCSPSTSKPEQQSPAWGPDRAVPHSSVFSTPRGPCPVIPSGAFKRRRAELAVTLYQEYNALIFDNRLPADLAITWNPRLSTTAGLTHYSQSPDGLGGRTYTARVELSIKVVDGLPKLKRTLCHELCHVAAWLLDHCARPPHGDVWRGWADRAQRAYPELEITTCHSYDIFFPHRWQCTNAECGATLGRHSKSIDVNRKVCGRCRAPLEYLGRFQADNTPAKPREATGFSLFVKQHFAAERKQLPPGTPHGEVMKQLSLRWGEQQRATAAASTDAAVPATDAACDALRRLLL
ncbi:hypothetical protein ACKKBG_A13180 [Auxenochlorella protothecoides x Auxenochlorella symbiontica]